MGDFAFFFFYNFLFFFFFFSFNCFSLVKPQGTSCVKIVKGSPLSGLRFQLFVSESLFSDLKPGLGSRGSLFLRQP